MEHSFDIDIATKYGMAEAILFKNISFWVKKNRANNENYYANTYWTYNSIRAYKDLFPYLTTYQVRQALKHLTDTKMIVVGNFNKSNYDRTSWYSIGEEGAKYIDYNSTKPLDDLETSICRKPQMEDIKTENGIVENHQPIPYINTYINTNKKDDDNNNQEVSPVIQAIETYFGMKASPSVYDVLNKSDLSDELKIYALQKCDESKVYNASYLKTTLYNLKAKGFQTVAEAEAEDERRMQAKQNKSKNDYLTTKNRELDIREKELALKEQNRPYYQMQIEMQSGKVEQKKQEEEKHKDYFKLHDAYIKGEISREEVLKSGIEEVSVQFWDAEIFNNTPEEIELQKKWEEHLKKENEMKKERKKW